MTQEDETEGTPSVQAQAPAPLPPSPAMQSGEMQAAAQRVLDSFASDIESLGDTSPNHTSQDLDDLSPVLTPRAPPTWDEDNAPSAQASEDELDASASSPPANVTPAGQPNPQPDEYETPAEAEVAPAPDAPATPEQVSTPHVGRDASDQISPPGSVDGPSLPEGPPAPSGESSQLMLRLAAMADAKAMRSWVHKATDADLQLMIQSIRALHASWLHTDASLINVATQFSLLQMESTNQAAQSSREKRVLTQERTSTATRLADAEERIQQLEGERDVLRHQLNAKDGEIDGLTMALQQAILEQKGAAEASRKWRKSIS